MLAHTIILAALTALVAASPIEQRANPCFIIGSTTLPAETVTADNAISSRVTCSSTVKTIDGVPDVTSGSTSFSSINFAASSQTPLTFSLSKFATKEPLASNDLAAFVAMQDVYTATEGGIRSVGGSLAIKVPKFFINFQIARIQTAQGITITDPSSTVDHLLGKVTKNAAGESQALLDQVTALSKQLS